MRQTLRTTPHEWRGKKAFWFPLTANYTKWWLLQWSLSIFPHRPFWQHYFHYFNFIFIIAKIHLCVSTLHSVIPSIYAHSIFCFSTFQSRPFDISGFSSRCPFHQRFFTLYSSLSEWISCLAHVECPDDEMSRKMHIKKSFHEHLSRLKLTSNHQIHFDIFPPINITHLWCHFNHFMLICVQSVS